MHRGRQLVFRRKLFQASATGVGVLLFAAVAIVASNREARRTSVSAGRGREPATSVAATPGLTASTPGLAATASTAATSPGLGSRVATRTAPQAPQRSAASATSTTQVEGPSSSSRDDNSGLRLALSVPKTTYRVDEEFALSLVVENVSDHDLYWDPNPNAEFQHFRLTGASTSWEDDSCPPSRYPASNLPARTLRPGERVAFSAAYPARATPDDRSGCGLPAGMYDVSAWLNWCAETRASVGPNGPERYCTRKVTVQATPLRLRLK